MAPLCIEPAHLLLINSLGLDAFVLLYGPELSTELFDDVTCLTENKVYLCVCVRMPLTPVHLFIAPSVAPVKGSGGVLMVIETERITQWLSYFYKCVT